MSFQAVLRNSTNFTIPQPRQQVLQNFLFSKIVADLYIDFNSEKGVD